MGFIYFGGAQQGSSGDYQVSLNCNYSSNGTNANSSNVETWFSFRRMGYSSYWQNLTGEAYVEIWCDGQYQRQNFVVDVSYAADVWQDNWSPHFTFTVPHNNDGTKNCAVRGYVYLGIVPSSLSCDEHSFALDTIPRYCNFTMAAKEHTMTSVRIDWSADAIIADGNCTLDGGTAFPIATSSATQDKFQNSFYLTGLKAGTSHSISVKLMRKDSGLWTTKTLSFTTLAGATISNLANINALSNDLTFNITNPGSGYLRMYLRLASNWNTDIITPINLGIVSGNRTIDLDTTSRRTAILNAMESISSSKYRIYIDTFSDSSYSKYQRSVYVEATMTIPNDSTTKPTIDTSKFSVLDSNNAYVTFDSNGNNGTFVQGLSNITAKILSGVASAKYSATIASYKISFNGTTKNFTSFDSAQSWGLAPYAGSPYGTTSLTLTVTDSRGFTSSATKNIVIHQYSAPTLSPVLTRQNNFESPTAMTISGAFASVNGKNIVSSVQYRFGQTATERNSATWRDCTVSISGTRYTAVPTTLASGCIPADDGSVYQFAVDKSYEFQFRVVDKKNNLSNIYTTLSAGIPVMCIGDNGKIGINKIPSNTDPSLLQVNGNITTNRLSGSCISSSTAVADDNIAASTKITNALNSSLATKLPLAGGRITGNMSIDGAFTFNQYGTWLSWATTTGNIGLCMNSAGNTFNLVSTKTGVSGWEHNFLVFNPSENTIYIISGANTIVGATTFNQDVLVKQKLSGNNGIDSTNGQFLHNGTTIIHRPANQQLLLAASEEANYRVFLGVRSGMWGFSPYADGIVTLGFPSYRWEQVYSSSGSISTSDRNEKHDIESLNMSARDFILGLNPVSYKMNNGISGRTHMGMIAQDVEDLLTDLNMTSKDFAGFIKSPKYETVVDEDGTITEGDIVPDEYIYGLRYEEFISPLIKTVQIQQEEIDTLKDTISKQQEELEELKRMFNEFTTQKDF